METPQIDGIYPLNFIQQTLLFHSLREKDDQGYLQVECVFNGQLDRNLFENCWNRVVRRHEPLRTSVHWENIENPVQVIYREAETRVSFSDWSSDSIPEQEQMLSALKKLEADSRPGLSQPPVAHVNLIKTGTNAHIFLWGCHHILADGWSAAIILKELLAFYNEEMGYPQETEHRISPSRKVYLNFIKTLDSQMAESFWKDHLKGFEHPSLIAENSDPESNSLKEYRSKLVTLSIEDSESLRDFGRKNRVTLSTLVHGLWALLLSRYLEKPDISFGTIVSGRSIGLPDAEVMTGMHMNVLPIRINAATDSDLPTWLNSLQQSLASIRGFEFLELDKIRGLTQKQLGKALFDTLVVFENIPLESKSDGGLSMTDFKSGLTTTYPLTIAVRPVSRIEFYLKYNSALLSGQGIAWWSENLASLAKSIVAGTPETPNELVSRIPLPPKRASQSVSIPERDTSRHIGPGTKAEQQLAAIWEEFFDGPISIDSDFFALGGSSIIAVSMFARMDEKHGYKLPVTALFENPTIQALGRLINDENDDPVWSSLVPLRATGSKPPIFCMHSGGAHILYYKAMSDYLDSEQPVYGIQPLGLDGSRAPQETVEEMAAHYLDEIRAVQPAGPYIFVGYCFSNAVCLEMAIQLRKGGENNFRIIIIDSHPMFMPHDKDMLPTFMEKLRSYKTLIRLGNWNEIFQRSLYKVTVVAEKLRGWVRRPSIPQDGEPNGQADLEGIQSALGMAYNKYVWKPAAVRLTLILCGDLETNPWQRVVIGQWKSLAMDGVDCHFVPGSHMTLFDEPAVRELADRLQTCLDSDL